MDARLAVFDLDGTLVDTAPDLVATCNTVLARRGVGAVPADTLRPFIGLGARAMIEASLRQNGVTLPDDALASIHADYLEHYATRIAALSRPFPAALDALDTLDAQGIALAVCTNKREGLARQLLSELGLIERFGAIAGLDTFGIAKPDPRHLLLTVDAAGGDASRTVFVGDSRVDRQTAAAAKIPFVGLGFGYGEVPMATLDPDRLCGPDDDIAAAVLDLMGSPLPSPS